MQSPLLRVLLLRNISRLLSPVVGLHEKNYDDQPHALLNVFLVWRRAVQFQFPNSSSDCYGERWCECHQAPPAKKRSQASNPTFFGHLNSMYPTRMSSAD